MRHATITALVLSTGLLCSCATVLPNTDPEHQLIAAAVRVSVESSETTVKNPVTIKIRGNMATAYYTVEYRTAQQSWNPMKSTLVKQAGTWMVKESKSTKPWYYRYK